MNDSYLILIGNGFDLAHGMKTSYSDFMRFAVNLNLENQDLSSRLFTKKQPYYQMTYDDVIKDSLKNIGAENIKFHNELFRIFLTDLALNNWCDLEDKYFEILKRIGAGFVKKTNLEFEEIKNYLSDYLFQEQKKSLDKKSESYSAFFNLIKDKNFKIVNFNYTNTLQKYNLELENKNVIHIHGELGKLDNPIIFGYAADDEESRGLSKKKDNEYLRNIKKICYKETNKIVTLEKYITQAEVLKVCVFGHSCGESDKLILNQIFNNEKVKEIRLFFYENAEQYREQAINIDRIMNNDKNFNNRLVNKLSSHRMPQLEDDLVQIEEFKSFVNSNLIFNERFIPPSTFHVM